MTSVSSLRLFALTVVENFIKWYFFEVERSMHIIEFSISFEKLQIWSESAQNESLVKDISEVFKTETEISEVEITIKVKVMTEVKMMISEEAIIEAAAITEVKAMTEVRTITEDRVRISVRLIKTMTVFVIKVFKFFESWEDKKEDIWTLSQFNSEAEVWLLIFLSILSFSFSWMTWEQQELELSEVIICTVFLDSRKYEQSFEVAEKQVQCMKATMFCTSVSETVITWIKFSYFIDWESVHNIISERISQLLIMRANFIMMFSNIFILKN